MPHKYADKYVHRPQDIPKDEHWAIIRGSSVHHDAVGVWAPGHGYPEHTEQVIEYEVYLKEEDFINAMEHEFNSSYPRDIIGIHVDKLYTKHTSVKAVQV